MYWSRVGRPILMSSWTLTDSTTSMLKPYGSSCFWTSAISSTSQISPGILLCRAQTMLVTPGICLMSDSVILSLPSPYQRKPICIGIVFLSFVLNLRSRPAPGTERHLVTFHSSISIQVWQVVIYPFFWVVFCGLYLNKKNREKNLQFLTVDFSILTRIFKIGAELQRVAKAPRSRGNPFLPAYAGQKFLPPGIPLGTKFSSEPCTRRKAARTLSALNFPVCVPTVRTCRPAGTFLTVWNFLCPQPSIK